MILLASPHPIPNPAHETVLMTYEVNQRDWTWESKDEIMRSSRTS